MKPLEHCFRLLCAQFEEHLRIRNYAESDVRSKAREVNLFFLWVQDTLDIRDVQRIDRRVLVAYQTWQIGRLGRMGKPLTASTVSNTMSRLCVLFAWLKRSGKIYVDPSSDLELPRRPRRVLPRYLEESEVLRLLAIPDSSNALGSRDLALLELLYSTGLRCGEMCGLRMENLDMRGMRLMVNGKGSKEGVVPFGEKAGRALANYLAFWRPRLQGQSVDSGFVFLSKSGRTLRRNSLQNMVRRCGKEAGLDKNCHPHMLRHSCATHLLCRGADIRLIQALLRHSDLSSTQIYTHVDVRALKDAQRKYHPREQSVQGVAGDHNDGGDDD